jgi:hypothetical protein
VNPLRRGRRSPRRHPAVAVDIPTAT